MTKKKALERLIRHLKNIEVKDNNTLIVDDILKRDIKFEFAEIFADNIVLKYSKTN